MPQEGEPTYAAKLGPDDLRLDWSAPADPDGAKRKAVEAVLREVG